MMERVRHGKITPPPPLLVQPSGGILHLKEASNRSSKKLLQAGLAQFILTPTVFNSTTTQLNLYHYFLCVVNIPRYCETQFATFLPAPEPDPAQAYMAPPLSSH